MSKTQGQKQSQLHERRLEKAMGGKRTAASGAFWSRKGDVRTDNLLVEHKYTAAKSFSIKSAELRKIETEAILDGRMPVFAFHLHDKNYVILLEDDFLELAKIDVSR